MADGRGRDFVLGAVVGGVVGAVTALLLAPKSGKELRADLCDSAQQVGVKTQELAGKVGEKTQQLKKQLGEQTDELMSKMKEAAGELRNWKESRKEVSASTEEELLPADADVLVDKK